LSILNVSIFFIFYFERNVSIFYQLKKLEKRAYIMPATAIAL